MLEDAFKADDMYKKGHNRPLEGLPIAVKDNIDILSEKGAPVTAGTSALLGHQSRIEGGLWKDRLKLNGAICAGRTTMSELGMGTATKNYFFGSTRSCWDTARTAGGSSGGSGGAVGSGLVSVALATDTAGGIRIPAACNGVVGFRPTVNRWPQDFGLKLSNTMDSIGPIACSVRDVIFLDSLVTEEKPISTHNIDGDDIKAIRIGVPCSGFYEELHPHIMKHALRTIEKIASMGMTVVENDDGIE
jgi:Asp-tRNA(Asn)/Glu-tRNA(Gln) amidotransferase A subunit family amidase